MFRRKAKRKQDSIDSAPESGKRIDSDDLQDDQVTGSKLDIVLGLFVAFTFGVLAGAGLIGIGLMIAYYILI